MSHPYHVPNRVPLVSTPFVDLPLGAVQPRGWLRDQLTIQAHGLTGHLDEIWESVGRNSGWLGGTGENWERGPYYCDGLIPLAYALGDARLIAKAQKWVEWSLASQDAEGNFGPADNPDWWPRMVMLKALLQYQEATDDERVIPFMSRYLRYQLGQIRTRPLEGWGAARGAENIYAIYWLYNRTGEEDLLELADILFAQSLDWTDLFSRFPYVRPIRFYFDFLKLARSLSDLSNELPASLDIGAILHHANQIGNYHAHHVVNVAMGVKNPALYYQQSGDARHRRASEEGIAALTRYHGQVTGVFTGDEHLSGTHPSQGTELCAVVEYLFSLQTLLKVCPENIPYADLMERVAYNALPAPFTPGMWRRQYDQQANQVLVSEARRNWYDNGDDANLFGLEPHFGCCTANMHQGWPKLLRALWLATADGGLVASVYAPSTVTARVGQDAEVQIVEETGYPFEETVRLTVHCRAETRFPLRLRVPGWCADAACQVNDAELPLAAAGQYLVLDRAWRDGDRVTLRLPMAPRAWRGERGTVGVLLGPLVLALKVKEAWCKLKGTDPYGYWEIHPNSPWNYALALDPDRAAEYLTVERGPIPYQPFAAERTPVRVRAKARRVPGWTLEDHSAGTPPESPVASEEPVEEVELIPYAAAKLRVSEFPYVQPEA